MKQIGPYHYQFKKSVPQTWNRIVAIDTEWAKNWRADEKFAPFCLALHSIYFPEQYDKSVIDIDTLCMKTELYFRSEEDSIQDYIDKADVIFAKYVNESTLFVGHQISSDLHTFLQCSSKKLETIPLLIRGVKERKNPSFFSKVRIADTRYDIKKRIVGNGAEKLRNVSLRLNIFAIQTELDKMSLTKMYNQYIQDGDKAKREKLTVMNWRHAFQTALIWLVDYLEKPLYNSKFHGHFLVTNDIMFEMGKESIEYLDSAEFNTTRSLSGITKYIERYYPKIDVGDLLCEE